MGKIVGRVQLKYAEAVKSLMTTAKKAGVRAPYNQEDPLKENTAVLMQSSYK